MRLACLLLFVATISLSQPALAMRTQIRVVGSSTVFPFVAAAAEQFGRMGHFRTPIVESTGTGGGIKMFCAGVGDKYPDMANASRAIKQSELDDCAKNGVKSVAELKLGYDGIVIANARRSYNFDLSKNDIFLALAPLVPKDGKLVKNPYQRWKDIRPDLPDLAISFYGPPPTSGTRDAFVELVMHDACADFPEFLKKYKKESVLKSRCGAIREDGMYVDAGENDNIIVQKLAASPHAVGVFGYSFLAENSALVKGNLISGVEPTFANIADGTYGVARSLFVYVKGDHVGKIPGLGEFVEELTGDAALAEGGYLLMKGLIPLPAAERLKAQEAARAMKPLPVQ